MATKAQYPYHGGQPKQGAGAGANAGGKLINGTPPNGGRKANGASPKANQHETPPVKMHR